MAKLYQFFIIPKEFIQNWFWFSNIWNNWYEFTKKKKIGQLAADSEYILIGDVFLMPLSILYSFTSFRSTQIHMGVFLPPLPPRIQVWGPSFNPGSSGISRDLYTRFPNWTLLNLCNWLFYCCPAWVSESDDRSAFPMNLLSYPTLPRPGPPRFTWVCPFLLYHDRIYTLYSLILSSFTNYLVWGPYSGPPRSLCNFNCVPPSQIGLCWICAMDFFSVAQLGF